MMKKNKTTMILIFCLAAVLLFAGCDAMGGKKPSPSPTKTATATPTKTATPLPTLSPTPMATMGPSPEDNTASPDGVLEDVLDPSPTATDDAAAEDTEASTTRMNAAEQLSAEVVLLDAVHKSTVLIADEECLVGLEFVEGYEDGLTEEIKNSIYEKALAASADVQRCAITADAALVARIAELADEIRTGEAVGEALSVFHQMVDGLLPDVM